MSHLCYLESVSNWTILKSNGHNFMKVINPLVECSVLIMPRPSSIVRLKADRMHPCYYSTHSKHPGLIMTDGRTDRRTDRLMVGRADRQTDVWTDRGTDTTKGITSVASQSIITVKEMCHLGWLPCLPCQWWRDLFRCRIDLLNFAMGFNIIAPYMVCVTHKWISPSLM